jgi:hypothetical protein
MFIKYIKINTLGILFTGILLGSCNKIQDFGDINENPNGSTTVNTGALLSNVLSNLGGITSGIVPGAYSQYFAESTYPGNSLYSDPNFSSSATYSGNLQDCQKIISYNTDAKTAGIAAANGDNGNQIQIAKILKAYHFSYITDRYGDIPYSEALGGVTVLSPKYDDQESIYKSMIADLTNAVTGLNTGGFAIKGDIAYSGDIAKWKKLANSLRMLFSLRLSERFPGSTEYAAVEFNKAATNAAGYISSNADNFMLTYPGGNIKNPYFALGQTLDNAVSSTFTTILSGLSDTRLSVLSASSTGVAYGLSSAAPSNAARIFTASYRAENSPFYFVTASHVLLALAEGIELGWVTGKTTADAQIAYNQGITASFAQWGVAVPSGYLTGGADYTSGGGVAVIGSPVTVAGSSATTSTKLERIWLQQYIAYYPDGTQGWNTWRRTGMPNLKPTINASNSSKQIVRRYTYAPDEYSYNSAQLATQISKMGGNTQDKHVWWDKN